MTEQHTSADLLTHLSHLKARSARFYYDDPARALALGEEAVALATASGDPECLALALWTRGNACMFVDRYRQAATDFEEARRLYLDCGRPDEAARLAVGQVWALAYLGEFDAAHSLAAESQEVLIPLAQSSVADRRRLAGLINNLGIIYRRRGRYEMAVRQYKKAIKVNPRDENIYYNLARTYFEWRRWKKALAALTKALKINPDFAEAKALAQTVRLRLEERP